MSSGSEDAQTLRGTVKGNAAEEQDTMSSSLFWCVTEQVPHCHHV